MKQELDFIVIGAQKSGTTSLFEYLRRHPELALPAAKEIPYFSHDARYGGDWDQYLAKAFPFVAPELKWGTVTPHYLVGGIYDAAAQTPPPASDERTVPLRIRERLPHVRLIAILRDPVARARSHHAMAAMNGWDRRDFATAMREQLAPEALAAARRIARETTGYVVWGEYGRILRGYVDVFDPERLLVLYTSELKQDPAGVLRRVYAFIGVDEEFVPDNLGVTYREGASARRFAALDLYRVQRAAAENRVARALWRAIPEPGRRRVDQRFDHLNLVTDLWNRRRAKVASRGRAADASPASQSRAEAEAEHALRAHYQADGELLAGLFGTAPSWAAATPSASR